MIELKPDQYSEVLPLLNNEKIDTVQAIMVLEQKEYGSVFADREKNPSSFLVVHNKSGFSLVFGQSDNADFNNGIKNLLLKTGENKRLIKLFASPGPWKCTIEKTLGDKLSCYDVIAEKHGIGTEAEISVLAKRNVIVRERIKFKFDYQSFKARIMDIPDEFSIKRIDHELINKVTGHVVPSFLWSSDENFLRHGVGFCLMKDQEIVSTSFSAFISEKMIDIGIETKAEYRGRGLGVYTAAEMIKYCLNNGYEPIWGCRKDNLASARLAKKLGFIEVIRYPWYFSVTGE